ncbi:MAG: DUF1292 domain-containing protein [Clostridia bacterium]|nr:DUF1292 domain-containing protein [Clostridia bacterium]
MAGNDLVVSTVPHDEDDEIITLTSEKGEKVDFIVIAGIEYHGDDYMILQPVKLVPGMSIDEAFVFKVTPGKDDDKYELVIDPKLADTIFDIYDNTYDEENEKEILEEEKKDGRK